METMKSQKILNLLNKASDSNFLTQKWSNVNDKSNTTYAVGNDIIYSTKALKFNLCNFSNTYILVTCDITILGRNNATQEAFKHFSQFFTSIKKIGGITIDHVDVYFIRNCSDYSHKTRSLWFYSKDGTADYNADIASTDNFIVFYNFYKSFKYKAKLLRNTEVNGANGI